VTLSQRQAVASARYALRVVPSDHVSVAETLLQLWDMPWSARRLKYAAWALRRAKRAGCDVLA
jgi:uncharacterized protein YfaQ (DUF2300 family)